MIANRAVACSVTVSNCAREYLEVTVFFHTLGPSIRHLVKIPAENRCKSTENLASISICIENTKERCVRSILTTFCRLWQAFIDGDVHDFSVISQAANVGVGERSEFLIKFRGRVIYFLGHKHRLAQ